MTRVLYSAGTATLTSPALSACASGFSAVNFWFTASTMRVVVVKSDCRTCRRIVPFGATEGAPRSTVAAPSPRPTVGWFTVCELPPLPLENPPVMTGPCATA